MSFAFDGQDGNGLHIEKLGQLFQVKLLRCHKMTKKQSYFVFTLKELSDICLLEFQV